MTFKPGEKENELMTVRCRNCNVTHRVLYKKPVGTSRIKKICEVPGCNQRYFDNETGHEPIKMVILAKDLYVNSDQFEKA